MDHLEPTKSLYNTATQAVRRMYPEFERKHAGLQHDAQFRLLVNDAKACIIAGWPTIERSGVMNSLRSHETVAGLPQYERICGAAIDFALRVWLMVDCCRLSSSGGPETWLDHVKIEDFVVGKQGWFAKASPSANDSGKNFQRFPPNFTAFRLEKICDIKVKKTKQLSAHLSLNELENEVSIFWHRNWLINERKRQQSEPGGLPIALLEETLRTLEVLFPAADKDTQKFVQTHGVVELSTLSVRLSSRRRMPRLRDFDFWRERLSDLVDQYQAPPRNSKGIWRDRRNPMAFWTFWIGLVIFFSTLSFGLVASVLAGVTIRDARNNREAEAIASLAAAISDLAASG